MKKIIYLMVIFPALCFAETKTNLTVADIANNITNNQLSGIEQLLSALSYIFGLVMGVKGILKLKEHNESKGQIKLVVPIVMIIASALFLALPSVMGAGKSTLFQNSTPVATPAKPGAAY